MKAIIKSQVSNAYNYSGQKEIVSKYVVIGKIRGEIREIVDARAYMGRSRSASTVYASIWVHGDNIYTSGRGQAGGYGYHKESAAIGSAISSAEIELYGDVYDDSMRWNYAEKRENTPAEIAKLKRAAAKRRTHIGGVGDSAIKSALLAIAKAAGGRGKLTIVSM